MDEEGRGTYEFDIPGNSSRDGDGPRLGSRAGTGGETLRFVGRPNTKVSSSASEKDGVDLFGAFFGFTTELDFVEIFVDEWSERDF
jgi:hypothetical protein